MASFLTERSALKLRYTDKVKLTKTQTEHDRTMNIFSSGLYPSSELLQGNHRNASSDVTPNRQYTYTFRILSRLLIVVDVECDILRTRYQTEH